VESRWPRKPVFQETHELFQAQYRMFAGMAEFCGSATEAVMLHQTEGLPLLCRACCMMRPWILAGSRSRL